MATYTAGTVGVHAKQLAAGVVDTVTFAGEPEVRAGVVRVVEVVGDGTAAIYFTVTGTPVVGSGDSYELPAGVISSRQVSAAANAATAVKLISSGTPKYSVTRA